MIILYRPDPAYRNLGDKAINRSTLEIVSKASDATIVIVSSNPNETRRELGYKYVIPDIEYFALKYFRWKKGAIWFIFYLILSAIIIFLTLAYTLIKPLLEEKIIGTYAKSRLLIVGGGGYFNKYWIKELIYVIPLIILVKLRGGRTIVAPQTIGPLDTWTSFFISKITLSLVDKIYVRDKVSLAYIRLYFGRKIYNKTTLVYDSSIYLFKKTRVSGGRDNKLCCINFRPWWVNTGRDFTDNIVEAVRVLANRFRLVAAVIVNYPNSRNDEPRLLERVGGKLGLDIDVFKPSRLEDVYRLLRKSSLAVGMSYHFLLAALVAGTPSIGIFCDDYYRLKLLGLKLFFGDKLEIISIDELSPGVIKEKIDEIGKNS